MLQADVYNLTQWQFTVAIGLLVLVLGFMRWYKRPKNFPPGPRGVPLLGAIPFMGKYPERALKKWSKSYGQIMSVRFGTWEMVVLNDYDSVHQAYVKQPTKFSGRPRIPLFEKITEGHGLATVDYGEFWKTQRKFGLVTLRGFGMGKQSLENKVTEEASYLIEEIRQKNGKAFDVSVLIHNSVSNIICNVCFGKRFEYDDPIFKAMMESFVGFVEDPVMTAIFTLFTFAPFLTKFPILSSYFEKLKEVMASMMSLLNGIIKEHEKTFDDQNLRDFIDAFLKEMKEGTDPTFTQTQLAQYVRDLFEAGTATTAGTLHWTFLCLIHYPEAQEKLRKEIMDVIGNEGKVAWQKRSDMPYTCAFMEEVFRFRSLIPLGLQHCASEDAQIGKYFIPKGTMITSNVWGIHNDENIWDQPNRFNPDRFLNEEGQFVRSQYVIPFSVGPRHCLGEQLARMEFFIFLVTLVQKFEFLPDPESSSLPDIEKGSNGMTFAPKSYKLVIKEL